MELFISWSGERSQKVAEALRDWLPNVIQSVEPFMSASDIEKGSRWSSDIATHLERAQFGLICLTRENLEAPWLLFEAGALSKSIENSRVVPYLYGISLAELQEPLAQFQAALADKSSTLEVVKSINEESGEYALESTRLEDTFEMWWPQLASILDDIPEAEEEAPPPRTDSDILEEVLGLCRQILRQHGPDTEIRRELARNYLAHGWQPKPADSTEDFRGESVLTSLARAIAQANTGRRIEQNREPLEQEMPEEPPQADPTSESGA